MRRRLLAGFLAFALILVLALEIPLGISLANNERTGALSALQRDAASLSVLISGAIEQGDVARARAIAQRYATATDGSVAVISGTHVDLRAGRDIAEELRDPSTLRIVHRARNGRVSGEVGAADPDDDLLYAAIPMSAAVDEPPLGAPSPSTTLPPFSRASTPALVRGAVLFVTAPAGPVKSRIARNWLKLLLFGIGALLLAGVLGAVLASSLTGPLAGIEAAVIAIGAGDLARRAPPTRGPTELATLADSVNDMADRLEELLLVQRAFVADASHQLRTPLTALRLRLENLELEPEPGDEATPDLTAAIAEADRLSRVVDGLLALARAEGTRPVREPVDVRAVVRERAEAWRPLAEERGITLLEPPATTGSSLSAAEALACPGHLKQVLDNLLANALDATPPGGTVQLRVHRVGHDVELHVIDTGRGMSAAERARAFDRFWRPEGAESEGTGLGLAIVDQLMRASGGAVELLEAESGGTAAVVRLEAC